jgi:penicillin-binding protein 1A
MVAEEHITAREMQAALLGGPRPGTLRPILLDNAYYTSWVRRELPTRDLPADAPEELRVVIGLDPVLQVQARQAVAEMLRNGRQHHAGQAALVAMDDDGLVRALVGGGDFAASQFDRATMGGRQPGSAFKPFVYLRALEAGRKPTDPVLDAPLGPGGWPRNFGGEPHEGRVTLQHALVKSLNGAAVHLAHELGPAAIAGLVHRLGIAASLTERDVVALGVDAVSPLALTTAYAAIANGGHRVSPSGILAVLTMDGKVLMTRPAAPGPQVVAPEAVQRLTRMLHEVIRSGTGTAACFGGWAAGKTGTTQDERDAWFVGFNAAPSLVTAIWIGNDDHAPMQGVSGSTLPAAAWRRFYAAADPRREPGRRPCAGR